MADIMKDFVHLDSWDDNQLFNRQAELKGSAPAKDLPDATLQELLAIMRVLRRRTTSPTAKAASSKRAAAPSLDAL